MQWTLGLEAFSPRRVNHAAAEVDDKIYSFGGYCTGEDYRFQRPIDVHQLDCVNLKWRQIPNSNSEPGSIPFQRYGHTVVAYRDQIILWGGRNDEGACNIVFIYDVHTRTWHRPAVSGARPGARDGHSACMVNGSMYIFGGFEDDTERFSQDLYKLDLRTMTWTHVLTGGRPPKWRDFHTASCIDDEYIYIFGGRSDQDGPFHTRHEEYLNELIYFDIKTSKWEHVDAESPPIGRRSHSAFVYEGKLYIFGGYNSIDDEHYNDVHVFDPKTKKWALCIIPGSQQPCPRRRQSCVLVRDKLYLFGGTSPIPEAEERPLPYFSAESKLKDQADLYILDFKPTLRTLCLLAVNESNVSEIAALPKSIQNDLLLFKGKESLRRESPSSG